MNVHAQALIADRRHYITCARNAVCELRYSKVSKRHYLHTLDATYALSNATACAVYECIKHHVLRLSIKRSMRSSVYTLRSDLRAIVRAAECAKFAH